METDCANHTVDYDSRAFRLPLQDAHFIEIDHPNTQSGKQNIIRRKKYSDSSCTQKMLFPIRIVHIRYSYSLAT